MDISAAAEELKFKLFEEEILQREAFTVLEETHNGNPDSMEEELNSSFALQEMHIEILVRSMQTEPADFQTMRVALPIMIVAAENVGSAKVLTKAEEMMKLSKENSLSGCNAFLEEVKEAQAEFEEKLKEYIQMLRD